LTEAGYQQSVRVRAGRERVWDAIGTLDGPRHWWTTTVSGSAAAGGELRFGFAGRPEEMIMLGVASHRPASVAWRCVSHNREQEWTGTQLSFELADRGPGTCEHSGLPGEVVAAGWRHFLASLAAYAEGDKGGPFGA